MLPVRVCGGQGFKCAAQGLGCMGMSAFYGGFETEEAQEEAFRVLNKAGEFDSMMLDTADIYGPYRNEQLIGTAIASKNKRYIVASKCGIVIGNAECPLNSSAEYIKKSCYDSLERLEIDYIDLYYLHRYDGKTPIEETMRAFKELVEEGKIKYVGVSEMPIDILRKAHAICPITAYQMEWSLFTRDVEEELVPTCRELGIGIVAYSPLGRGFLTGTFKTASDIPMDDLRRRIPRFNEYIDNNLKLVNIVKSVAKAKGCTIGQVALAWLHAQGEDVFPIPGTKKLDRFLENIAAFNIQLTQREMKKLNSMADKIKGARYSDRGMMSTFNPPKKEKLHRTVMSA